MLEDLKQHPEFPALQNETHPTSLDLKALISDAMNHHLAVEDIISALKKATHYRARSPIAYARTILKKSPVRTEASPPVLSPKVAERVNERPPKIKETVAPVYATEAALQSPAYAPALDIAKRLELSPILLAGWLGEAIPEPRALEKILLRAEAKTPSDRSIFALSQAFFGIITEKGSPYANAFSA
jgi:hypothetical protein